MLTNRKALIAVFGQAPLHVAAAPQDQVVDILLDHNVFVNVCNKLGRRCTSPVSPATTSVGIQPIADQRPFWTP